MFSRVIQQKFQIRKQMRANLSSKGLHTLGTVTEIQR